MLDSVEPPVSISHIKYADFRNWEVKGSYLGAVRELMIALDLKTEYTGSSELQVLRDHLLVLVTLKTMADVLSQLYFQVERLFFVPPYNSVEGIWHWYAESVRKTWDIEVWQRAYNTLDKDRLRHDASTKSLEQVVKLCKMIERDYRYFSKTSSGVSNNDYYMRMRSAKEKVDELSAKVYGIILEIGSLQ